VPPLRCHLVVWWHTSCVGTKTTSHGGSTFSCQAMAPFTSRCHFPLSQTETTPRVTLSSSNVVLIFQLSLTFNGLHGRRRRHRPRPRHSSHWSLRRGSRAQIRPGHFLESLVDGTTTIPTPALTPHSTFRSVHLRTRLRPAVLTTMTCSWINPMMKRASCAPVGIESEFIASYWQGGDGVDSAVGPRCRSRLGTQRGRTWDQGPLRGERDGVQPHERRGSGQGERFDGRLHEDEARAGG